MYRPVFNPYNQARSNVSCGHFCILFIIAAIAFGSLIVILSISNSGKMLEMPLESEDNLDIKIADAFEDFVNKYQKDYVSAEETAYRFGIFKQNYLKIEEFNANPYKTCSVAINEMADLTDEEYEEKYLSKRPKKHNEPLTGPIPPPDPSVVVNWEESGNVTKIKDQGNCGSCWTFASISVVESLISIKTHKSPERYSEQQLVDCCRTALSQGCDGGEEDDAFHYMMTKGITLESNYPYAARDQYCEDTKWPARVKISGYANITAGDNAEMEKVIKNQTIAVGVAAGHFVFRFYHDGVVTEGCDGDHISHAVTVVGAGIENNIPYWYVRNSWGKNWGLNGYMKIARTADGTTGICGISCCAQYPIF